MLGTVTGIEKDNPTYTKIGSQTEKQVLICAHQTSKNSSADCSCTEGHCKTNKYCVSFNCAISLYVSQHFTFHNIILLILWHYGERVGIQSCKCIYQMRASKWIQIKGTEPHWLLAIHGPAFYIAHHTVQLTAC